jgi:hypothetical protein
MMYKIFLITRTVTDIPEPLVFRYYAESEQDAYEYIKEQQAKDIEGRKIEYHVETIYHCRN